MSESLQEKIEDKIIDYINLSASGRLIVFRPKEKIKGVSLIVKKKGEYDSLQVQPLSQNSVVKTKIFGVSKKKNTKEVWLCINGQNKTSNQTIFKKEINVDDFKENKNLYFIFSFLNVLKQDIDDYMCILSPEQFKKSADIKEGGIYSFESFLSPDKKDKYSKFLINKKDLSKFLLKTVLA